MFRNEITANKWRQLIWFRKSINKCKKISNTQPIFVPYAKWQAVFTISFIRIIAAHLDAQNFPITFSVVDKACRCLCVMMNLLMISCPHEQTVKVKCIFDNRRAVINFSRAPMRLRHMPQRSPPRTADRTIVLCNSSWLSLCRCSSLALTLSFIDALCLIIRPMFVAMTQ